MLKRIVPLAIVVILVAMPLDAAERVAVIPAGGEDAGKLSPLIEIALGQHRIDLVERESLHDVLAEQELQAALAPDGVSARLKLGHLLKADFLVFVRCPDQPSPRLEVTTCETIQGIRLAGVVLGREKSVEKNVNAADAAVVKAIAKSKLPGLTLVAIPPWSSDDFSTQFDYRRAAFRRLLEGALANRDDLVLVEFAEAKALGTELAISGQAGLNRKRPLILNGRMKHASTDLNAKVTVSLNLTRGSDHLGNWNSGQVDVKTAAETLPPAATALLDKARGMNVPASSKLQADELVEHARELMKSSFFNDAYEVDEAALLLDPENVSIHGEAYRSLTSQIILEFSQRPREIYDIEKQAETRREFDHNQSGRLAVALNHLEFYLARTNLSRADPIYMDLNRLFLIFEVPPREALEANYRILKYKKDHTVEDNYEGVCWNFLDSARQHDWDTQLTPDQEADYYARLFEVWTRGTGNWHMQNLFEHTLWLQRLDEDAPPLQHFLLRIEKSDNPEVVKAAGILRDQLKQKAVARKDDQHSPVIVPRPMHPPAPETVTLKLIHLPITTDHSSVGSVPAGPHADVLYGSVEIDEGEGKVRCYNVSYFKDDGWGRTLPQMADGCVPIFDGRYVWYGGIIDKSAALYVYDSLKDKLYTAQNNAGVPPDPFRQMSLVTIAPGKVCIAAAVGPSSPSVKPARTWVGIAEVSGEADPHCKTILECRDRDETDGKNATIGCAFDPGIMLVLPGPPGSGDKATPHIYIGRRMDQMILVDLKTMQCSLAKCAPGTFASWLFSGHAAVWEGKVHFKQKVWDPASDKVTQVALPEGGDHEVGISFVICNGVCYMCDGDMGMYVSLPGQRPLKMVLPPKVFSEGELSVSSLFGLLLDGHYQVRVTQPVLASIPAAVADEETWLVRHSNVAPDADGYQALIDIYTESGDYAKWLAAEDGYFKYAEHTLPRAYQETTVADSLMGDADYTRARKYADDAAQSGAEWAIQSAQYVAEGLGQWDRAENLCKHWSAAYGDGMGWFLWCVRTGHGDRKSAQAQAQKFIAANERSDSPRHANRAARCYLVAGDKAKAMLIFQHLVKDCHFASAGLELALDAAGNGDTAKRDEYLDLICDHGPARDVAELFQIAQAWRECIKTRKPLDQAIPTNDRDDLTLTTVNYFAGRILIVEGHKETGIALLKRASGLNSPLDARSLAAQSLRSMGIEPPTPGMSK